MDIPVLQGETPVFFCLSQCRHWFLQVELYSEKYLHWSLVTKIVFFFTFCKNKSQIWGIADCHILRSGNIIEINMWVSLLNIQYHWVAHNLIPYEKHNHAYWPKKLLVNAYFFCFLRFAHDSFGVVIIVAIHSLTWPWVCLTIRSSLFSESLYTLILVCSFCWLRNATQQSRLVIKRHYTLGPPFFVFFFSCPFKKRAVESPDLYQ